MRKGTDLIGKPVVSFDTGEQFETIHLVFHVKLTIPAPWLRRRRHSLAAPVSCHSIAAWALGPEYDYRTGQAGVIAADTEDTFRRILEHNNVAKGTRSRHHRRT